MEVAQFGIEVVLIEPGPVKTPWTDTAAGSLGDAVSGPKPTPTRPTRQRSVSRSAGPPAAARPRCLLFGHLFTFC
jgi:NAD(P)-dependent dehydrogenase (short-subunit alcohol dehydrogenase family)